MDSGNLTRYAIGGIALIGVVFVGKAMNKQESSSIRRPEEQQDTFESHVTQDDGNGLVELSKDCLWHVTTKFNGNGPPWRRMIIYCPPKTTSLLLVSPTAARDDIMQQIEALGSVDYLIIPNAYHRADAAVYHKRYPKAKVATLPDWVRKKVSEIVPVDMNVRELANIFHDSIKVLRIGGMGDPSKEEGDFEYAYEFRCSDQTLAFYVTDALFNFQDKSTANWIFGTRGIEQMDGCCTPVMGRISKYMAFDKKLVKEFYSGLAKRENISMILMAHGDVFVGDTQKPFQDIADNLK
ncbi:unnamed protein product [Cylindrotheca closterium]|uniref:Uncharacterized protein n=1 Tax=Cylindrotheca closterium TaxID=2856 RepID=A0AAD2FXC9_9STRA|nr:unnamed protein product [Cylindrotheca closterium]